MQKEDEQDRDSISRTYTIRVFYGQPTEYFYDVGELVSIGVTELCRDRQLTDVNGKKLLNANASKGEVTVSAKNVKFRALTAKAESFAV